MLDVEVVTRQGSLSEDDWWDLRSSASRHMLHRLRGGTQLPVKLLRLGVRYADGAKATTIDRQQSRASGPGDPPTGPLLSFQPGSSGMGGRRLGFQRLRALAVAASSG
jgi:hypothetical protein